MRRVAISFSISLAIVGLLFFAVRAWLFAGVLVWPGLKLSSFLIPRSAWPTLISDFPPEFSGGSQSWMSIYLFCGILINGLVYTWPVLLLIRVGNRIFSK